jgi:opacity protein-like surface antigen
MRKTLIAGLMAALLLPLGASAQSNEELLKQIQELRQQLQALEQKVAEQPATPAPNQEVKNLDARLAKVERKTAGDNIQWGGDIRVGYDYQNWSFKPYQQFMGFDPMTGMPMYQQVDGQNWNNSAQYNVRLRLKMNAQINDNLRFMGRLSMYKLYGGADVPVFNGFPNTVYNSFNSTRVPSNDVLHVERALLRYDFPNAPFTLAMGRMNTSDGPPMEVREVSERQATPQAIMVNAEIDGFHIDYHMDRLGLPEGTTFGICAGVGYESGFGGGGQVNQNYTMTPFGMGRINAMKDSTVIGGIFDMPLLFQAGSTINSASFILGYNRFGNMTDIPFGSLVNFPIPGPYAFPAAQYVTATNNLGDMDQWGVTWKHNINDVFTYFISAGYIRSHPNGKVSQYGFGGLLGDPNHSKYGYAYYTGVQWKPVDTLALGLEFNHGSKRWFTYTPSAGEPSDKLAARGSVWEGYAHYEFAKNVALKVGYTYYDYSTAFSGWHIAPGDLDYFNLSSNPMSFYPFPKTVKNAYLRIEAKF